MKQLFLIVSALVCMIVAAIAMHTFSIKAYCDCALLGLATGLGAIAAIWLTYALARPK